MVRVQIFLEELNVSVAQRCVGQVTADGSGPAVGLHGLELLSESESVPDGSGAPIYLHGLELLSESKWSLDLHGLELLSESVSPDWFGPPIDLHGLELLSETTLETSYRYTRSRAAV